MTYKSMISEIGVHYTFSWDTGIEKEEFQTKFFEPIKFSLPFAGLLIRPFPTADEAFRGRSRFTSTVCLYRSADIISSGKSHSFSAIVEGELCVRTLFCILISLLPHVKNILKDYQILAISREDLSHHIDSCQYRLWAVASRDYQQLTEKGGSMNVIPETGLGSSCFHRAGWRGMALG